MKVLAVASNGGHFVQLRRLVRSLGIQDVTLITTYENGNVSKSNITIVDGLNCFLVNDANAKNLFGVIKLFLNLLILLFRIKPTCIISTGAAPGALSIIIGKVFFNSKTIWVDSIANAEQPSLSAKLVKIFCNKWITQSEKVSKKYGMLYLGELI